MNDTPQTAATGSKIRVHYVGKLENGQAFDRSDENEPLELTIGSGQLMAAFENAFIGMAVGEQKEISLTPDEAFGPHRPELVNEIDRAQLPPEIDLQVGIMLTASDGAGKEIPVMVTGVADNSVTLDANHPLAGKALGFDLTLVEIVG